MPFSAGWQINGAAIYSFPPLSLAKPPECNNAEREASTAAVAEGENRFPTPTRTCSDKRGGGGQGTDNGFHLIVN